MDNREKRRAKQFQTLIDNRNYNYWDYRWRLDTRIHNIWYHMIDRCNNKDDNNYINYGGRGISVCEIWQNSFMEFFNWSICNGYADDLQIDRINNDGNYYPENCRWVTRKENCNNTRTNIYVEISGITKTISQWAEYYNISRSTIYKRLNADWDIIEAITTKVRGKYHNRKRLASTNSPAT